MMSFFSDQPVEIIDYICSFVDSPRDLLSLALVSKRLCQLVIPDHIECRHICCDSLQIGLWEKLVDFPSIASRFVSLEVTEASSALRTSPILVPRHHSLLTNPDRNYVTVHHVENQPAHSHIPNRTSNNHNSLRTNSTRKTEHHHIFPNKGLPLNGPTNNSTKPNKSCHHLPTSSTHPSISQTPISLHHPSP